MRFLVFMIPAVYQPKNGKKTDPNFTPDAEMIAKMDKFNDELKKPAPSSLSMASTR